MGRLRAPTSGPSYSHDAAGGVETVGVVVMMMVMMVVMVMMPMTLMMTIVMLIMMLMVMEMMTGHHTPMTQRGTLRPLGVCPKSLPPSSQYVLRIRC